MGNNNYSYEEIQRCFGSVKPVQEKTINTIKNRDLEPEINIQAKENSESEFLENSFEDETNTKESIRKLKIFSREKTPKVKKKNRNITKDSKKIGKAVKEPSEEFEDVIEEAKIDVPEIVEITTPITVTPESEHIEIVDIGEVVDDDDDVEIKPTLKERIAEKRRIAKLSKQISKNIARTMRYTEPKNRNLLSRIILQERYMRGEYFEDIEYDYEKGYLTYEEVEESKNSKSWFDKRLYKKVQAYEDAVEDVTVRKGWISFKVGLAAITLAGIAVLGSYTYNMVDDFFDSLNQPPSVENFETISPEEKEQAAMMAIQIKADALNNSGYQFNHLSDADIAEGYHKIAKQTRKITETMYKNVFMHLLDNKDQELLETTVKKAFGEEEYAKLTDGEKRDYKQIAYEILPYVHSKIYGEISMYVRNPVLMDVLKARNNADDKGYRQTIKINADEKTTIKNFGNLMQVIYELKPEDYESFNSQDVFFETVIKQALGNEIYDSLGRNEKRDYVQYAYEFIPESEKEHFTDPIELDILAEEQLKQEWQNKKISNDDGER